MNYDRTYSGQPALPPQKMVEYGSLSCQYTGVVFCDAIVDGYNCYTRDFNRTRYRSTQEFLLDQRHRYIHSCMLENLELKREAGRA